MERIETDLQEESLLNNQNKEKRRAIFSDFDLPLPNDSSLESLILRTKLPEVGLSNLPEIEANKTKILEELLKKNQYKSIFENFEYYSKMDLNIQDIYTGVFRSGDYDYILRNRKKFIEYGIQINIQELGEKLIAAKDWDSIINNLSLLSSEIGINVQDIYNGFVSENRWFSILNNKLFFEKNGILLNYQEIYEGLVRKQDYNTITNNLTFFSDKDVILDYGDIYQKIFDQNDILAIADNQNVFIAHGIQIVKDAVFENCINKHKFDVLIENYDFFVSDENQIKGFIERIITFLPREDTNFILKHYSVLKKYNVDFSEIKSLLGTDSVKERLLLEQRFDILNNETDYFIKNPALNSRVISFLEQDGRINMRKSLFSNSSADDLKSGWKIENNKEDKIIVNDTIALFYYYQFIKNDINQIERIEDYSSKIESEHLYLIEDLKRLIESNNEDVTNFLRNHLIKIIRDRLRRSKIESKTYFTLSNPNIITREYTNDEILDFFASTIGAFAEGNIDKSWIQIAYSGYNLFLNEFVESILLDYVFSLQHNNGSIFNRGNDIICDEEQCMSLLNHKRDSANIKEYLSSLDSIGIDINPDYVMVSKMENIKRNYLNIE